MILAKVFPVRQGKGKGGEASRYVSAYLASCPFFGTISFRYGGAGNIHLCFMTPSVGAQISSARRNSTRLDIDSNLNNPMAGKSCMATRCLQAANCA